MSGHRSQNDRLQWQQSQRYGPPRPRDDFYDERRSRSRSTDRNKSSPQRRRSPPLDVPQPPTRPSFPKQSYKDRSPRRGREHSRERRDYHNDRSSRSPQRRNAYHDRGRPHNHNRHSRSQSRSSQDDRPSSRGRPSKEVIMEGLAVHLTENDIATELKQSYRVEGLDDVRVIRDRQTKQSRQFGFLRFLSLEDAEYFMDKHYPHLYIYDQQSTNQNTNACKVRIAFGREKKEHPRNDEPEWMCALCNVSNFATRIRCFRCSTNRSESEVVPATRAGNNGDNDASPDNTPSQFLLFRGLESSVSEELFAKGVAKLNKPPSGNNTANQAPNKKGAKVASTTGDSNLGAKEGSLRRILLVRDRKSNECWRYGFAEYASIEDAQAALIRYNSFDRFTIASKPVLVSYIHAGVFIPVLKKSSNTERFAFSPLGNPSMKLIYWDEGAYVSESVINVPEISKDEAKQISGNGVAEEALKALKDAEKLKKRKAQADGIASTAKKPAASHLQFWSDRHAELHGINRDETQKPDRDNLDDQNAPPVQSYADPNRNCCYLCMRQFPSTAEVNRHERLSDLHRENLKNEIRVQKANAKLEKHGVQQQNMPTEYRDRARERRKIYGVIKKKGEQVTHGAGNKNSNTEEETSNVPVQSKGASLLSKMGYTAGQGLGASGEGITAPISQDVYVGGVGLGAVGGKLGDAVTEGERNTKGDYSAFAERTREGARERYSRM